MNIEDVRKLNNEELINEKESILKQLWRIDSNINLCNLVTQVK